MADAYFLSESDRKVLREMIAEFELRRQNVPSRSEQGTPSAAPEVYVARVPASGIPALTDGYTGTGTGTGSLAADSPGYAVCAVYKVVVDSTGTPDLIRVADLNKVVYNLSTSDVTGSSWVLVSRDKFGYWYAGGVVALTATNPTGATIVDHVHVVESIADTGTGTAGAPTWYCERVAMPSGGGWPPVADPTTVYNNVRESENRYPRIMDAAGGTVTHIIPLYEDGNGNQYIVFWKTDTTATFEAPTSFAITQDPATCTITATPVLGTYTISLTVTPTTDPRTGLTLVVT